MKKTDSWRWLRYGVLPVVLALFLSPAMAQGYGLFIAGVEVTDENCNNLSEIAGVTVGEEGEFVYDADSKTLTMKDVTIKETPESAIYNKEVSDLNIVIAGSNMLTAPSKGKVTLRCDVATNISGEGTLTVHSQGIAVFITREATLTVSKITLNAEGIWGIAGPPSIGNATFVVNYAILNVKGYNTAIGDLKAFTLEGSYPVEPARWNGALHAVMNTAVPGKKAVEVKVALMD